MYIIEDLHTSYWKEYGSLGSAEKPEASSDSTIRFLQNLIDDLNYSGARTACADKQKVPTNMIKEFTEYQSTIHAIYFYTSLCIIVKD